MEDSKKSGPKKGLEGFVLGDIKTREDPKEPEKVTRIHRVLPKKEKTGVETLRSRVVVISPYSQLNVYIESIIPEILDGGYTDIVDRAEMKVPPYIDVNKKEKDIQSPLWIIDFGKIIAPQPKTSVLANARVEAIISMINNNFIRRLKYNPELAGEYDPQYKHILAEYPFTPPSITKIVKHLESTVMSLYDEFLSEIKRIDESIKAEDCIDKVVLFNGYAVWAKNKSIVYLFPRPSFLAGLEKRHSNYPDGNFNPSSVSIKDYTEAIRMDLQKVATSKMKELTLFDFKIGYK